ncbi:YbgC/FadM family acyl-CoA thioesterase [Nitrospirillum sp. BR 11164]|uniref:YbgC/FadM family acyl-CoA thioesterase n=1 Tax=Nitrospirillum sp. BR 11164 TaxID=3104324 RepID=UPI002B000F09|nr:YbgC/FadM family acyl-CoA thioesterase [Nitrospirillum sp. BR 11164]MEA1650402.1 YbgC/FadM family acyl-CoA thioesterase [Nitrospirillum sp. BR 11164]
MSEAPNRSVGHLSGHMVDDVHHFPVRVYYEDTDAGGIVYHANYLRYAERARTEMLRTLGVPHAKQVAATGVAFAVRRCTMDFLAPARLEDTLLVRSRITSVTGATVLAEQTIYRPQSGGIVAPGMATPDMGKGEDQVLVRLSLKLACINAQGRAVRVPTPVAEAFARLGVARDSGDDARRGDGGKINSKGDGASTGAPSEE